MSKFAERLRFLASGQDDPQSVALDEAADEIERHFNQVAALLEFAELLRKDAARYRWIRGRCRDDAFTAGVEWEWYEQDPEVLDAAIDAAMKAP